MQQLGYNDEPATRDLLLKTISHEHITYNSIKAAYTSARRLFGKDSLGPNYGLLQNPNGSYYESNIADEGSVLEAVVKKGDPLHIMEIFPNRANPIQEQLETALPTRPDLPVKEATAALAARRRKGLYALATRLLGRVPNPDANVKTAIGNSLAKWWAIWQERRVKTGGGLSDSDDEDNYSRKERVTGDGIEEGRRSR